MGIPKKDFELDLWKQPINILHLVQYESAGRDVQFRLLDDGRPYDVTGKTVLLEMQKPDRNIVVMSCDIVSAAEGIVKATIVSQAVVIAGEAKAQLRVSADGQLSKSFGIRVLIAESINADGIAESTTEFTALQDLIVDVQSWENKIDELDDRVSQIITTPAESVTAQEIIDARDGETALGDRLNRMEQAIEDNEGRGIASTVTTYGTSASGTDSGTVSVWESSPVAVAQGEYLWTKTVDTYTDATTETRYSVARMGVDGADATEFGERIDNIENRMPDSPEETSVRKFVDILTDAIYCTSWTDVKKGDRFGITDQTSKFSVRQGEYNGTSLRNSSQDDWVAENNYAKITFLISRNDGTNWTDDDKKSFGVVKKTNIDLLKMSYVEVQPTLIPGYTIFANPATPADLGTLIVNAPTSVTDFILVDGYSYIKLPLARISSSSSGGLAFYGKNKQYLTNSAVRNFVVTGSQANATCLIPIPEGAWYVRSTVYTADIKQDDKYFLIGQKAFFDAETRNLKLLADGKYRFGVNIYVAASNATENEKAVADFVCDGVNDEVEIQQAIDGIPTNKYGKVFLSSGDFYLDSFKTTQTEKTILILNKSTEVQNKMRLSIEGVFRANQTTALHVTSAALDDLGDAVGCVFNFTQKLFGNLVDFARFAVYLADNQHKVTVVNYAKASAGICEGLTLSAVPPDISNTNATPMPVEECVGITGYCGDASGTHQEIKHCFATGFYEAYRLGGEHLVCTELNARLNYYSYTFGNYDYWIGTQSHPITLINCCDEHAKCLPKFVKCGYFDETGAMAYQGVDMISFNLETSVPANFGGGVRVPAHEETPGSFCGRIDFLAYGAPNDGGNSAETPAGNLKSFKFWDNTSGKRFRTLNQTHAAGGTSLERALYTSPSYMQQYFDETLGKLLTYNGTAWVDAMGNAV